MEAIRKFVPSLGRSASNILEVDVTRVLVETSSHMDRLREYTRDDEYEGRYAQLCTRYETLKVSPNPSTDEVKELLRDLEKFCDAARLRKDEEIRAILG